jgi:dienelactone hydrolase
MFKRTIIATLLIFIIFTAANASDIVTFKGMTANKAGTPLMLTGKLTKPQGNGPFAAVVLLHGCSGPESWNDMWAERLKEWGYVTLAVDSFAPRGQGSICRDTNIVRFEERAKDAYAAKSYLAGIQFVDSNRIAVMGMSHGGGTIMYAINTDWFAEVKQRPDPFRAAITLYPLCQPRLKGFNSPLLILIGGADRMMGAKPCQDLKKAWMEEDAEHEVILKVYPGATHCFDWEGYSRRTVGGRLMEYDPAAATDANARVRDFLGKYLQ